MDATDCRPILADVNAPFFRTASGLALASALGWASATLSAQESETASASLPTIPSYANSGPFAGVEAFDVAEKIGTGPGAILFIHVINRNTAPVIRNFDQMTHRYQPLGMEGFILMLSDDRTAAEEQLKRVNGSLRLHRPIALSLDGIEGPGALALDRRLALTLVVVADGREVERIEMNDTGSHDFERIKTAMESSWGGLPESRDALLQLAAKNLPEDPETLRALAAEYAVSLFRSRSAPPSTPDAAMNARSGAMRRSRPVDAPERRATPRENVRPAAEAPPQRRGAPPTDIELNSLLRSFIRQTNSAEQIEELMTQIESRAQVSDELNGQAIAMFQLMLSYPDRYGSDAAKEKARAFLRSHGAE